MAFASQTRKSPLDMYMRTRAEGFGAEVKRHYGRNLHYLLATTMLIISKPKSPDFD